MHLKIGRLRIDVSITPTEDDLIYEIVKNEAIQSWAAFSKIRVINKIRDSLGYGLREAKDKAEAQMRNYRTATGFSHFIC